MSTGCVSPKREERPLHVRLVTLGRVPSEMVSAARDALAKTYGAATSVSALELPTAAYYAPRGRYRAEELLTSLSAFRGASSKVIGLTQSDISTTYKSHKDWGLFGLADNDCCVVSTFRLRKDRPSKKRFLHRLKVIAVHEVGHTLGLAHCSSSKTCPMQDAEGSIAPTDRSSLQLCEACRSRLHT